MAHTQETKDKISKALSKKVAFNCDYCGITAKDKPSSYARKARHFCSRFCYSRFREEKLPKHEQHAWKGGIAKENQSGRGCKKYKEWQKSVMDKSNRTCTCGEPAECCHHLKGWTAFPELRYDTENGIALCGPCHYKIHYENPELLNNG